MFALTDVGLALASQKPGLASAVSKADFERSGLPRDQLS